MDIKKVSESMARGDYTARVQSGKKDEIGRLARTIDDLGAQLAKTESLRKELIANVSHELRTPLSLIRGYAETLRDVTGDDPEKRRRQLGIIIEETERLGRIVEDMLNLSRLQAGYFNLDKSRFKLLDLLLEVKNYYAVTSENTGVSLVLQEPDCGTVEADRDRIKQVIYNLVNNSFNHTQKGGVITISCSRSDDNIRIFISDTGSGIPEEDLPHIFDRYYQSGKAPDKRKLGTGLGLAIVKSILDAHQFPCGVESRLGHGTTIWFELKKI